MKNFVSHKIGCFVRYLWECLYLEFSLFSLSPSIIEIKSNQSDLRRLTSSQEVVVSTPIFSTVSSLHYTNLIKPFKQLRGFFLQLPKHKASHFIGTLTKNSTIYFVRIRSNSNLRMRFTFVHWTSSLKSVNSLTDFKEFFSYKDMITLYYS